MRSTSAIGSRRSVRLAELARQGLVEIDPGAARVTPLGCYFVRAIAMVFDAHLRTERAPARYSRVI
jgi:oxygen-independent coproporphyrinogen-3 oxidase